jgi:hypothetical protein
VGRTAAGGVADRAEGLNARRNLGPHPCVIIYPTEKEAFMSQRDRKAAEATFDKRQKRESEIAEVIKQEDARRDAAVKNMQRLRALRIERDAKNQSVDKVTKRA